jgi:hypothetical protein
MIRDFAVIVPGNTVPWCKREYTRLNSWTGKNILNILYGVVRFS